MKRKIFLTALILFQLILRIGSAQNNELKFNLVLGPDGKPFGNIRSITQDSKGYMWFAAQSGKCIYRYDGNRFTVFRHDDSNPNSLGGANINSIYADAAGIIWVGMGEGLDQYNPSTGMFKHFLHVSNDSASLSEGLTMCPPLKDSQSRLWVGTNNGLDRLDERTGKFIHYHNEPGNPKSLSNNTVWKIYEDRQGVIWIGTGFPFGPANEEGGLNRLNADGTFTRYMHDPKDEHSIINNKIGGIYEDSRGVFWVGTGGDGLHTMDRKTGKFERHLYDPKNPEQLSRPRLNPNDDNDKITFINGDSTGAIWIGTVYSGINRYDTLTKKITHYENSHAFTDNTSWTAFSSKDGTVWIATVNNNLFRVDPFHKSINTISTGADVSSFLEDKEGYLWVGTKGKGLLQYDQQKKLIHQFDTRSSKDNNQFNNFVYALFQYQSDTIWMGTDNGVEIFDKKTQQFSRFPMGFAFKDHNSSSTYSIYQDHQGLKWFATGEGMVNYNPASGSIKRYKADDRDSGSIGSERIISFLEDGSGNFWVGAFGVGINRLDRQTDHFRHYLKGYNGICMYYDSQGTIWAGMDRGLYRYNIKDDSFIPFFDAQSEISHENIYGIIEDEERNLWLSTPSSIIKINPDKNESFVYGSRYNIAANSVQPNAIYKTGKGQLLFGKDNGYYAFFPDELAVNTSFQITITDFFLNNLPVLPVKGSVIQRTVEEISDLDLQYNQNNIAFNFSANDYHEPESIHYFTMLENYDNTWREVKGDKSSYYFNLAPGKYMYRIKAFNSDGSKAEKVIAIQINPPWWQTGWARGLFALLLVISVWGYIRWRTLSLQKEKVILETKVTERTTELMKEKEIVESTLTELKSTQAQLIQSEKMASLGELTAGIAHEIQNPLNFVNNFSEINTELAEEAQLDVEEGNISGLKTILNTIKENEKKINHHGKRAESIVKGMLQHGRKSSGVKEPTDINALADEYLNLAYHSFKSKHQHFKCELKTEFEKELPLMQVVPQDIGRVLLNLLNNAFWACNDQFIRCQSAGIEYHPEVNVATLLSSVDSKDAHPRSLSIIISDNGSGIPDNIKDKIFQPFFTTKPAGQGTGLGLSLAYDIIKSLQGEINVPSQEGKGTEFTILLPL